MKSYVNSNHYLKKWPKGVRNKIEMTIQRTLKTL